MNVPEVAGLELHTFMALAPEAFPGPCPHREGLESAAWSAGETGSGSASLTLQWVLSEPPPPSPPPCPGAVGKDFLACDCPMKLLEQASPGQQKPQGEGRAPEWALGRTSCWT